MTTINIAALPAAGAFADADIAHLSQSGADVKTTVGALKAEFVDVDVFGLTEDTTPDAAMFVAVGVDATIANNKKVSLDKMGELFQTEAFFTDDNAIDVDDEIIYRKDAEVVLKQVTVGALAARILTLNELSTAIVAADVNDADFGVVYDTSAVEAKKITIANYRQAMLTPTTLSALDDTTIDNADYLYTWDTSTTAGKKITYAHLKSAIVAALPFSDAISSVAADSAAGLIDFTAGIKTNSIVPTSGTAITINATVTVNSELISALGNFTNVKGKFLGTNGNAASLYIDSVSAGSKFVVKGSQLSPVDNATTDLGTATEQYKTLYLSNGVSALRGWFTDYVYLPKSIYIRNVANTADTSLMSGDTINTVMLPAATTSAQGALLKATLAQLQTGVGTSQAITPDLFSAFGTMTTTVLGGGDSMNTWKLKIGGLIINAGLYVIGTPVVAGTKTVTFPTAFTTGYTCVATPASTGANTTITTSNSGLASTDIKFIGSLPCSGFSFIAIGS